MDVALEQFYSLPLRETFKIFHRGGIAVAHVLRKCIEQVKLNDQCQGVAEIKKKTKGCFEKGETLCVAGGQKVLTVVTICP